MEILDWKELFKIYPIEKGESNPDYYKRLSVITNKTYAYVYKLWRKHNVKVQKTVSVENQVKQDQLKITESVKVRELTAKYNYALKQLEESELRYDTLLGVKQSVDNYSIEYSTFQNKHEAVPIIQLSDWHFEEKVDSVTINNLNEYNPDIASTRWTKCVQNSLKLVHKERSSSNINKLVIHLGGDFITGYIHEELEESNYLSPTEATRFAKKQIITALKFYKEHGRFNEIVVICSYGNHGRTTKKPRVSTGYKNSYEWMMYKDIEDYFEGDKLFTFIIPNGLFAYVDVMGNMCRWWHGDTIQYGGGIGGLTIPLIKAIHRYDQQILASYNFIGHYHQLFQATKNCLVNGSGIGFSPYAQKIGASPEDPMQSFSLIDSKYGMTIKTPIFCK